MSRSTATPPSAPPPGRRHPPRAYARSPRRRLRWLAAAGLSLVLLAAGLGTALVEAGPATAAAGATITGVGSGRCLDVPRRETTPGTRVIIYDCNGQSNQAWTYTPARELRVYDTPPMCLDVAGRVTTSPAVAQIYTCNGGANQQWRFTPAGTIVGVQSGLCLDVTGAATANASPVALYTCHGGPNQRWTSPLAATDSTPPSVPGNARVSGLTCRSVTLSWDAASDDVGVAFYDVYHDGQLMTSVAGSVRSAQLNVVAGVRWGLYVNARDAAGNVSQASATVPITPPQCSVDSTPPTAPTGLVATASGTTVSLRWTAATDDVGVRAYDVYRGSTLAGTVTGTASVAPGTTFTDSALAADTSYSYTVAARDAQGNVSPRSAAVGVRTGAVCAAGAVCGVQVAATDTDIPWGVVPLADGTVVYSRRDAHDIVRLNPATGAVTKLGTVPNVQNTDGEGGLLGLAVGPQFATDHWLYVMHTSPTDNRIVRIRLENDALVPSSEQVLLSGILRNKFHNGGRLRFGPDGKLYASTGDAQNGDNAQNLSSLNGKVLRLNADGSVPADNPYANYVWSYGHRNPQGLAFDSQGRLWEQEFGNAVMDETNLITKGGNYGWPACEGTSGACATAGFIAPKRTYPTSEGSCSGITIVRDVLYVACERGERLYREVISGSTLVDVSAYFIGQYGRLRTVEAARDGGLWLTTSTQGDKDSIPDNSNERVLHVTLGA